MTLTEFLLARIAEDEAVARAAIASEPETRTYHDGSTKTFIDRGEWEAGSTAYDGGRIEDVDGVFLTIYDEGGHTPEQAVHIARHDPARVLAECAAKRRVVEAAWADHLQIEGEWGLGRSSEELSALNDYPDALRALASVYVEHADFQEEWRV